MKKILFYYPSNSRSVQIESTLKMLQSKGYRIYFLTSCAEGPLHKKLQEYDIETFANPLPKNLLYYFRQLWFLVKFCRYRGIDIVFSNLQHSNFIAVIAQFFMPSRIVAFRHHFKFHQGNIGLNLRVNKNELLFDRIINALAYTIVVPSKGVYNGILKYEKVAKEKLKLIPYVYDFSLYPQPDVEKVNAIKSSYPAKLRIIMVGRLIPFKRMESMLPVYKQAIESGLDIQVLILGDGPLKSSIEKSIQELNIQDRVHLLGFKKNIIDYLSASDLIMHPSVTEASSNVIKEMGLQEKAVCVCKHVGDFDEYIVDGKNGYLMDLESFDAKATSVIQELYHEPDRINQIGKKLKESILGQYNDSAAVMNKYDQLINQAP